jgi:hypothetical protein
MCYNPGIMMIFVDESEWPKPSTPGGYTVWAGVGIHPKDQRQFFRDLYQLEKKFWKSAEPYDFEIKGRLLLSNRALSSPKKREFVEEILSLCKLNHIITFAVGLRYSQTVPMDKIAAPNTFLVISMLCERIERMMEEQYKDDIAIIVFDSQEDQKDQIRALEFGNYIYGTPSGRGMSHLVCTPLFGSSVVTKGIQIADLFAYALAQQNTGRTDIRSFCDRIREMEWRSAEQLENRPWRGFSFRDMTQQKDERIGDALQPEP